MKGSRGFRVFFDEAMYCRSVDVITYSAGHSSIENLYIKLDSHFLEAG